MAEVVVMHAHFPGFQLTKGTNGSLTWVGVVTPTPEDDFLVAIVYPDNYPYQSPALWALEPPLRPGAPHLYMDGSLCIHANNWDPERGTAASCVTLAAAWLVAYEAWRQTGLRY